MSIVGFQIEIEKIFSMVKIVIRLRCWLDIDKSNKKNLIMKN